MYQGKLVSSSDNKTFHLTKYLKRYKVKHVPKIDDSLQTLSMMKKDDGTNCVKMREFDLIVAWQKIAILVVKHKLSLNFVKYDAFRDLMCYSNQLVKMMSRNTLKGEILKLYQAEKAKTMALLEINNSRKPITTDMWTTTNQR